MWGTGVFVPAKQPRPQMNYQGQTQVFVHLRSRSHAFHYFM